MRTDLVVLPNFSAAVLTKTWELFHPLLPLVEEDESTFFFPALFSPNPLHRIRAPETDPYPAGKHPANAFPALGTGIKRRIRHFLESFEAVTAAVAFIIIGWHVQFPSNVFNNLIAVLKVQNSRKSAISSASAGSSSTSEVPSWRTTLENTRRMSGSIARVVR